MKILHVSQFAFPFVGGLEKLLHSITTHQAKTHHVHILTLSHNKKLAPIENKSKKTIRRMQGISFFSQVFFVPQKGFCQSIAKTNPDVLWTHTRFFATSFLAGWYFKRKFPNRIWIHLEHGQNFVVHKRKIIRVLARMWDEIIGRWIFSHADRVIVVSPTAEKFVISLGAKCVSVISSGVSIPRLVRIPRKNKALFFGRMREEKGILDLLLAVQQNPQWTFECVGDGPLFSYKKFQNLSWTAAVGEKELFQKIQSSDLIIFPSWSESVSLAVLESASCGRAILACDVGENRNILSASFVIPARSPEILSQKIRALTNQFDTLIHEGQKNREKVRKNYSFDTMIERYDSIIAQYR
jgi:glycosyltransferase involved in cell wall biosynthesis